METPIDDIQDGIVRNMVLKLTLSMPHRDDSHVSQITDILKRFIEDNPDVINFLGMEVENVELGSVIIHVQLHATEERSFQEILEFVKNKIHEIMQNLFDQSKLGDIFHYFNFDISVIMQGFSSTRTPLDKFQRGQRETDAAFDGEYEKERPRFSRLHLDPTSQEPEIHSLLSSSFSSSLTVTVDPSSTTSSFSSSRNLPNIGHLSQFYMEDITAKIYQGTHPYRIQDIPSPTSPLPVSGNLFNANPEKTNASSGSQASGSQSDGSDFLTEENEVFTPLDDMYSAQAAEGKCTEVRMLLIGKTGTGKSSTGNMILRKETFKSGTSASSVTSECHCDSTFIKHGDCVYNVTVVDTPGQFGFDGGSDDMNDIFVEAVGLSSPGFHVIVLVLNNERFRKEDQGTLDFYLNFFGEHLYRHLIIAFTHRDVIENSMPFHEFLKTLRDRKFNEIKASCQNRVICFDNKNQHSSREQLDELFVHIKQILEQNDGQCFTDRLFTSVEEIIREKRKSLRKSKRKKKAVDLVKDLKEKYPDETLKQIEKRISEGKKVSRLDRMFSFFSANLINEALLFVEKEVEREIKREIIEHRGIWQTLKDKIFSIVTRKGSVTKVQPSK